jgi:acetoin utilization deacetylase AcuC-like enzyme
MRTLYNPDTLNHPGNKYEHPDRLKGFLMHPISPIDEKEALKAINNLYTGGRINLDELKRTAQHKATVAETRLSPKSIGAIIASVSLSIQAARDGDFALTRPPGHHANLERPSGFCLINNLAVAVNQELIQGHKVAVIDFDGHIGDGTQSIFADQDRVLCCSLHQEGTFGAHKRIRGKNIFNIPIPAKSNDQIFIESIKKFLDRIKDFRPDVIAISAGFDGCEGDPLLDLAFSKRGYHSCGKLIAQMGIRTFAVLEGGYHNQLKECIQSFISGFNQQ